ncbi:hypothetical protein U9M48_038025 [Paspalum notatum var. saurae]|uniref:Sulfotransferase n=1 Tax=Paspalum notatum var. saurae TaxID=547442 RepID=A0AAQ3UMH1_PASNO
MAYSSVQSFSQQGVDDDAQSETTYPELYQRFANLVSSFPSSEGLSNTKLYRHDHGWYCRLVPMVGAMVADACFAARPSDIIVATLPKSGTTWIKSLLYATVHRRQHPPPTTVGSAAVDHPFNTSGPHELVKFFEFQLYTKEKAISTNLDELPDPRLFSTHVPFVSLPRSVVATKPLGCKIVYVCRDPKDHLISQWNFANRFRARDGLEPLPVETAVELFCDGLTPFGPYWDHVLGYWHAHLMDPDKVLFFRYEEMQRDPAAHVRKLAEFVGLPFSSEEEDGGTVDAIVELCSFERMSRMDATKGGRTKLAEGLLPNSAYFRRGVVGDWANHLSAEMARRIDAITEAKFKAASVRANKNPKTESTNPELYQAFANLASSLPTTEGLSNNKLYRHEHGWHCSLAPMVGSIVPRSVVATKPAGCKIVYVCRDLKDHLISGFRVEDGLEPLPIETAVQLFCDGMTPFGPYWDHVLGYWHAHLADPDKVLFFRYEEMQGDPGAHVRKLAEFVGLPFSSEEEDGGTVDAIGAHE